MIFTNEHYLLIERAVYLMMERHDPFLTIADSGSFRDSMSNWCVEMPEGWGPDAPLKPGWNQPLPQEWTDLISQPKSTSVMIA